MIEINHTIFGIILFFILLILIYLLNRSITKLNFNETNTIEGFNSKVDDKFIIYDNCYFDLENKYSYDKNKKDINEVLSECVKDINCNGITINKNDSGIYYIIRKADTCYSKLQGSPLQRNNASNFKTYLKKTVNLSDKLCLTSDTMKTPFTIANINKLYFGIKNKQLYGFNEDNVKYNNMYDATKFKIVAGLFDANNTISIQLFTPPSSNSNLYLSHNFPTSKNIILTEIKSGDSTDIKRNASFRMIGGLNNEGFTLKILNFQNMYLKYENEKNEAMVIVDTINNRDNPDINKMATFYITNEIKVKPIKTQKPIDDPLLEDEDETDISFLSDDEKINQMKNKNSSTIEKQLLILENQNKSIKDTEFTNFSNIGKISREFANQSAQLALGKYLKEKNDIEILNKNNPPVDNTPSVDKFRGGL